VIILFSPLAFNIINYDYYKSLYDNNGVFSVLNKVDVLKLTGKLFDFFKFNGELDPSIQVRFADEEMSSVASFTQNEIGHLEDVRTLLARIFILYFASIAVFIILLVLLIEKNFRNFLRKLGISFIISSSSILFIFTVIYFLLNNFTFLFDRFHVLFFPQGNYIFSGNSLIIMLFPFGFFSDFFIRLAASSGIFAAVLLAAGIAMLKVFKPGIRS
jgi:hypothetical protein